MQYGIFQRREREEKEKEKENEFIQRLDTLKSTIPSRTGSEPGPAPRYLISRGRHHRIVPVFFDQQKVYDNGMTLEYKQSVVMETAAAAKNNKKYTASTLRGERTEYGHGRRATERDCSVFGLCGFSLFLLLVPVSGPHLEAVRGRST